MYLGCTKRECQISNDIVANYRHMFESRISAGAKEKLPTRASGKPEAETKPSWSFDMEGHAKKLCGKILRTCKENNSTIIQSRNAIMDDHQFKEEEENVVSWTIVYSLLTNCSEMSVFGSYWET